METFEHLELKRLAVAWIDLSDQMAQPEDLIALPKANLNA